MRGQQVRGGTTPPTHLNIAATKPLQNPIDIVPPPRHNLHNTYKTSLVKSKFFSGHRLSSHCIHDQI